MSLDPGLSRSQEACFSDVTNEDIYNANCTLFEKVKGEDRRISVKEDHTYMSEKFDCLAELCQSLNHIQQNFEFISSLSRARDADKKKHLLSGKFNVPQKMSNEERA